jgi:hypothetical protein
MRKPTDGRLVKRLELGQAIAEHALLIALLALVALLALAAAGSKAQDLLGKLGSGLPPIATSGPGNRTPAGQTPAPVPKVAPGRTPTTPAPSAAGAAEPGHAAGGAQDPGGHLHWTIGSGAGSVVLHAETTLRAEGN